MPNDAIFDDNDLKAAAQLVAGSMLDSLPTRAECEHEFSDDFTAKMDKLLHWQKRRRVWHTVMRYAAVLVITATLALGAVMAASPTARAAVLKWARELVEGNMVYHFYTEAPEETLPLYGLGWIPEGFEETDVFNNGVAYKAIYTNAETGKGFVFEYYYMDDGAVPMVIPEDDINLEKAKINDKPVDFYQAPKDEDTNILFIFDEESNICFTISASIDRDTMFKIAEHIYLAEAKK